MKTILISISIILIALLGYLSIDDENIQQKKEIIIKDNTSKVLTKEKVILNKIDKSIEIKSNFDILFIERNVTKKNDLVPNIDTVGKGLTLEGIQSTNISEEEEIRRIDDMVYYQDSLIVERTVLSDKDILDMIEEDVRNNLIN